MTTAVDWDKPIQTVDGKPARFLGIAKPASEKSRGSYVVAIELSEEHEKVVRR